MKNQKLRIVSLFHLNTNIVGKDMFLVPMYISQHLNANCELVYPKAEFNCHFNDEYRGVKLTPINSNSQYNCSFNSEKEIGWWLINNAKRIDVLFLFWLNTRNVIFSNLYKSINPKGVCYIKGDLSILPSSKSLFKSKMRNVLYRAIDLFSVETDDIYSQIRNGILGSVMAKKVVLMPNGFDIEMFEQLNMSRRCYAEKENILLTVGRIGSFQKNNEMILSAINGLDLKDWKLLFVGPVDKHFIDIYNDFLDKNPLLKDKVILYGSIDNRAELWNLYDKSKVFILSSRFECMAQVYSEALAFGNYIITTDVQGSIEITDNQRLGRIVGVDDVNALRLSILEIITGKNDISMFTNELIKLSNTKFNWRKLTSGVAGKLKLIYDSKNS